MRFLTAHCVAGVRGFELANVIFGSVLRKMADIYADFGTFGDQRLIACELRKRADAPQPKLGGLRDWVANSRLSSERAKFTIEWRIERRSGCPSLSSDRAAMFL